jgi:hypothetical protein
MSNSYVPLILFLMTLFIVGGFVILCVSPFYDLTLTNQNSSVAFLSNILNLRSLTFTGIPVIGTFSIPVPFISFIPQSWTNFIVEKINAFTYLPDYIAIPLLLFMLGMFIYAVLGFIPTMG